MESVIRDRREGRREGEGGGGGRGGGREGGRGEEEGRGGGSTTHNYDPLKYSSQMLSSHSCKYILLVCPHRVSRSVSVSVPLKPPASSHIHVIHTNTFTHIVCTQTHIPMHTYASVHVCKHVFIFKCI